MHRRLIVPFLLLLVGLGSVWPGSGASAAGRDVITVSAEGLSDPHFYKDRSIAYDEALRDAKRQALEKATGCFVSSESIVENYSLVQDRVISRTRGMIKKVVKTVDAGVQPDGFYHVYIKAEVFTEPLEKAVRQLSRAERKIRIRSKGNPTFDVSIEVRSPQSRGGIDECVVCATEIKDRLRTFGYKVISGEHAREMRRKRSRWMQAQGFSHAIVQQMLHRLTDVTISGRVNIEHSPTVKLAGVPVHTTLLTAWSLEAVDNHSSEVIFARNFKGRKPFNNRDEAIMAVGAAIGDVFSEDVFRNYVMRQTHDVMLTFFGIEDRRLARAMKKELLGLRSVLNVVFREFLSGGESVLEVQFAGPRESLGDILDGVVLPAFNKKYGEGSFSIVEEHGGVVRIMVHREKAPDVREKIDRGVPLQLAGEVAPERFDQVVKSPELKTRYEYRPSEDAFEQIMDL